MVEWLQEHGGALLGGVIAVLTAASVVVGNLDGPGAKKTAGWLNLLLMGLRRLSAVTWRNEPKSLSVPVIQGDSGKRVMGEVEID